MRATTSGSRFALAGAAAAAALLAAAPGAFAAPRNDDFGDAVRLRVGHDVRGNINGASKQRGEPRHAGSLATHSVWYRFRSRRKVSIVLGTCSTSFDSVVAVYSGRRLRGLREVDNNNDGCGFGGGSRVSFTARRGKTYYIAVVGFTGSGRFKLTVDRIFPPPNDDFADAVRVAPGTGITASTRSATRELHEPRHDAGAPHTVWFKTSVSGPSVLHLNACNGSSPSLTVYTGSSVSGLTRVAGAGCSTTFSATPGVTYRIVAENSGSGGSFRIGL
jgi:hypothetical protein